MQQALLWLSLAAAASAAAAAAAAASVGGSLRRLGGYERLLSRKTPGTDSLSLSHGASFILNQSVDEGILVKAVALSMARHPMLRVCINGEGEFAYCEEKDLTRLARRVVKTMQTDSVDLTGVWKHELERALNDARLEEGGPLWWLVNVVGGGESAWVFCVNHGIDDQKSLNIVVKDLTKACRELASLGGEEMGKQQQQQQQQQQHAIDSLPFPPSVEEAVAPQPPSFRTLTWALFQLCNALRMPAMVPTRVLQSMARDPSLAATLKSPNERKTYVETFILSEDIATKLRNKCRLRGVTVTSLLSASMLAVTSAAISEGESTEEKRDSLLRFLLSVDLRPFAATSVPDWAFGTVACAAGAVDFVVPVGEKVTLRGRNRRNTATETQSDEEIWQLALRCKSEANWIIEKQQWVQESVRLFGLGMQFADVLKVVELDAASGSLGRGFSCGVSNMGLASFGDAETTANSSPPLAVKRAYYGTSHSRNGVLCQLSCMTVGASGDFCGCLQFTDPLIPPHEGKRIAAALQRLLVELAD